ncbi:MAG: hypothetical protein VE98_C0001G0270 [candidate division Kazan bacterium GW2011_GWA1_50_15]|uniref:PsbP C-terminal domain-containing protein n=2 Tax=Bacteria division Kazan-3B-28 TaxID=1798534 RepID=A0A0G1X7H1_UNCK3|nr:MAG: hypothetical protein VE98_C0001G0270 [candidate division Kazan bacterium GW2011_GWA1_50_15]KKW25454.1 MAG: hypothetical protein VE99_C0001G0091 [candidate division Kazan bacterium GW2011_GWC1_52_13]KKW26760.1 MAG: hypothetical protein VF00_C0002G0085 [candidate division Kazan bacterium GW2011_GWB1_52_7]
MTTTKEAISKEWLWGAVGLAVVAVGWLVWVQLHPTGPKWVTSTSRVYNYQIDHPADWTFDDSQQTFPTDVIASPDGMAMVFVSTLSDARLTDVEGRKVVLQTIEETFRDDPNHTVEFFDSSPGTTPDVKSGYAVAGSYSENDQEWRFKEIGGFGEQSGMLVVIRGNILQGAVNQYRYVVDKITESINLTST